jgi:hypothetical protein
MGDGRNARQRTSNLRIEGRSIVEISIFLPTVERSSRNQTMKSLTKPFAITPGILCTMVLITSSAMSQTGDREKTQELLKKAEQIEYEHTMAAKQREVDRVNEDIQNGKKHADDLEKMINTLGTELSGAKSRRDQLALVRRQQPKVLEVISMRLEAENLRAEGLMMLEAAEKKALDALLKRNEEAEQRNTLNALEMKVFAAKFIGSDEPAPKQDPSLTELRKKLEKAERTANNAGTIAREAMKAASLKLQLANNAAASAENRRMELGLDEIPQLPVQNRPVEPPTPDAPKKQRPKR